MVFLHLQGGNCHWLLVVDGVDAPLATTETSFPMALQDPTHKTITKIGEEEFRIGWGTLSITVSVIGIFVNVDVH